MIDLQRPRDLGGFLRDAFNLYLRHFPTFFAIALAVVVPVYAAILGLGLGEFSGHYNSTPQAAEGIVSVLTRLLLVAPLGQLMVLYALLETQQSGRPKARNAIVSGLEAFRPAFLPVAVAVLCEVPTFVVIIGFVLFLRWYFVPLVVAVDGRRGLDALSASWALTRGYAWRVFLVVIVTTVVFGLIQEAVATPIAAAAKSANSQALELLAAAAADALALPLLGIVAVLLFYDLKTRRAASPTS